MFSGLSAFPLSPLRDDRVDDSSFIGLIARLVDAKVNSICTLGSTGNYPYLDAEARYRVAKLAVEHSGDIPVIIGIGAISTREVLAHAEHAQKVGASGLLLAPMSYQPLSEDEVFDLYDTVSKAISIPLCVYDNPTTTHFEFSDELYARVSELSQIKSIKIPSVPMNAKAAMARINELRTKLANDVTIGISGDVNGARGLNAGCDAWYSVIGGLFPALAMAITRAAQRNNPDEAMRLSNHLDPLWNLYKKHGGSMRTIAAAAEQLNLVATPCLPRPLKGIGARNRRELERVMIELGIASDF